MSRIADTAPLPAQAAHDGGAVPSTPHPVPPAGWPERRWRIALLLLVLATFAIRSLYFGNPFVDVDEEFYLLTGDRLLHGAIPYVDIWDRKPVGLFLLYGAIRLLGGAGIVQYQLVASAFAAATAVTIATMARRIAGPAAALVGGLTYVPALAMSGGEGGQTPVFYNLPMAVAAWLLFRIAARPGLRPPATILRHGAAAMLLVGIAMQIKYTAVFEGVYFGLALLWLGWRAGMRPAALIGAAALWAGLALAPTILAGAAYAVQRHGDAFVYANFTSITARGAVSDSHVGHDFRRMVVRMLVFAVPIFASELVLRRQARASWTPAGAGHGFVAGWAIAAVIGVLLFGTFFSHYALPLLPPLAVLAAPAFAIAWRHAGAVLAATTLLGTFIPYPIDARARVGRHGDAAYAARLAAAIRPRLAGRCLYVYYGEPILYQLTGSCLPTRWPFPFHLSLAREAGAMGVDALAETTRIMDARPPVVVDRLTDDDEVNPATQALVRRRLARDYHLIWRYRHRVGINVDEVWALDRP